MLAQNEQRPAKEDGGHLFRLQRRHVKGEEKVSMAKCGLEAMQKKDLDGPASGEGGMAVD